MNTHTHGRHSSRAAFTLIELLMAMAIGLVISNIALVSFIATQKYMYRIELLSAKNDAYQSMILWCITKKNGLGTTTAEIAYPTGAQFRHIGGKVADPSTPHFLTLTLESWAGTPAIATTITGSTLYVPATGD